MNELIKKLLLVLVILIIFVLVTFGVINEKSTNTTYENFDENEIIENEIIENEIIENEIIENEITENEIAENKIEENVIGENVDDEEISQDMSYYKKYYLESGTDRSNGYISTLENYELKENIDYDNKYDAELLKLHVNIVTDDVNAINSELEQIYYDALNEVTTAYEQKNGGLYKWIYYTAVLVDNILVFDVYNLGAIPNTDAGFEYQYIYMIDIYTGKRLSNQDVMNKIKLSENELKMKITEQIKEYYDRPNTNIGKDVFPTFESYIKTFDIDLNKINLELLDTNVIKVHFPIGTFPKFDDAEEYTVYIEGNV